MKLRLIPALDTGVENSRIKKLYINSFPAEERAPYWFIKRRIKKGLTESLNIMAGDEWVGWFYMVVHNDMAYIFYFVIDEKHRGKGYGTKAIEALKEKYKGLRIFLALEELDESSENYNQRLRRHRFYSNCGFEDLPHSIKEGTVTYAIMGIGGKVGAHEYKELIYKFTGRIFRLFVDMRIIE